MTHCDDTVRAAHLPADRRAGSDVTQEEHVERAGSVRFGAQLSVMT